MKILQAHSSHHFWTIAETITPCHTTRLFQILFWGKQFSLCPPISKDLKPLIVAPDLLSAVS
jgi:hypothetical protein